MAPSLLLVVAVAGLSGGLGRARAERVEDEDEAGPAQGGPEEAPVCNCVNIVDDRTCETYDDPEKMCNQQYHLTGIDADPHAYGLRINGDKAKDAGKNGYNYGGKAYAGGKWVNLEKKWWECGCCALTCDTCWGPMGTKKPVEQTPKKPPEKEREQVKATIKKAKTPDAKPQKPKPQPVAVAKPKPQPKAGPAKGKIAPEIKAEPVAVATPKAVPAKADPSCTGEVWCREWVVNAMGEDIAKDCLEADKTGKNKGRFFQTALNADHGLKAKAKAKKGTNTFKKTPFCSEVVANCENKIEGWCCWASTPAFPGPAPCDKKDYYPSGNECEQDFTCPKKYNLEKTTPTKMEEGCYPVEMLVDQEKQKCCAKPPCDDHNR